VGWGPSPDAVLLLALVQVTVAQTACRQLLFHYNRLPLLERQILKFFAVRCKKTVLHQDCCNLHSLGPILASGQPRWPLVVATVAASGGQVGRDSYTVPAFDSWMTPLFRGLPPGLLFFSASWPRPLCGLFPAGVPQKTVSTFEVTPGSLNLSSPFSSGTTHPGPCPRWFVGLWWTAAHLSALAPLCPPHTPSTTFSLPSVHIQSSPLILIQPPKSCLRLGNHQAAGVGSPIYISVGQSLSHPRRVIPVVAAVPLPSPL
jgi:hypothetical protein